MLFMMAMFIYSTVSGKVIDWTTIVGFIATLLSTHGVHLFSNAVNNKTAATLTAVQTTQNGNGKTNLSS